LDSLVAPIALYPDPLLAQVLAASTYPLEIISSSMAGERKDLKDKALACGASAGGIPVSRAWLGFGCRELAGGRHQVDRPSSGTLFGATIRRDGGGAAHAREPRRRETESNEQIKVETKVVESAGHSGRAANPQVVYVPSYQPAAVYGPPVYPTRRSLTPPPGYYAAGMAISFGVGVAMEPCGRGLGLWMRLGWWPWPQ
jgi:hypothetical protein